MADEAEHQMMDEDDAEEISMQVAHASLVDEDDSDSDDDSDEDEEEDDPMQDLPPVLVARVNELLGLNVQRDTIMEQYLQERAALEQKYKRLCHPLYNQRAQIIAGAMDDQIVVDTMQQDPTSEHGEEAFPKGLPQFWVCSMGHMEDVAELLTEEDVDCLEHLTDIQCHDFEDGKGFVLEFHFNTATNAYFSNPVLTKRYDVPNLLVADEPILKNVQGCAIDWKSPAQCLTSREVVRKQRGKGKHSGQVRTIKKQERKDSFFHFFNPPALPDMNEMDEEEADRLEEAFDADYDVAQAFRLHIVPKAVLWFTGQGQEEELQAAMGEMDGDMQ
jgi:nucleosome assembly protein 1-like 1